ncbi:2-oxoglutarate dehydrogenase E1 component [Ereboglobus luteus]|uniref:2-oxoglutarate dehydrogenase E1 component n=1 Tax=Ereboglobus luteus TaxID=1796921 RepID=A0A2U8DZU3_9BACT|nr:2-oxoglutarate dehydrogenase E1 component [Ereboglobus luteus]AWI08055.1 2-oxoglutarate dehydrogenase E1 component [Ereboglobus luteus]
MNPLSFPTRANADLIEAAYRGWLDDPDSVDPTWRAFFQGFMLGNGAAATPASIGAALAGEPAIDSLKQSQVHSLIYHYRSIGHLQAHLDPLSPPPGPASRLSPAEFGLAGADLDESFDVGHYLDGGRMRLRDLIAALQKTYCGTIGVEYIHIQDTEVRRWIQSAIEPNHFQPAFNKAEKTRILRRLHKAELFEKFLHTKYVGQKRFSLEGGETFIAALDAIIERCPSLGVEEIVMGMAHRGRLSVLANILRKPFDVLFEQFSENYLPNTVAGDGDVKYHLGFGAILKTSSGAQVEVRLAANPSHLEIVNPGVEGKTRARQRIRGDTEARGKVIPLLVHGDAALAGQGIGAETLQFSQLPGYRTGGTVHIVINNQIGFTTMPDDARSTRYCTDLAKMVDAPVFHVNGDDPEAVCLAALLALEFRQTFHRDVFVDMYCYRRHGHNESDEPAFTQPTLYRRIASHPHVSEIYTKQLIAEGTLTAADSAAIQAEYTAAMDAAFAKAKAAEAAAAARPPEEYDPATRRFRGSNAVFQPPYKHTPVATGVPRELIEKVTRALTTIPDGFSINSKIKRLLDNRAKALAADGPVDWGYGEALALGTLLVEGTPVRLSGQDCERGTFSHRHAVLYDQETRARHIPLQNLSPDQERFCVYNSLLSEAAVLMFEYGYSMDYPQMLCIWEAQFGDFANGAQVAIDQFIVSSESKWQRSTGLVLLLPHGYEGQGPEHSSARLERFLQACAENNIQVANPTTPAQIFHLLRRQMKRDFRKPLIVMSPKSLLRHPAAVSRIQDFNTGGFQEILDDPAWADWQSCPLPGASPGEKIEATSHRPPGRIILCSGKVYYDLCDYRSRNKITDTVILRIEQLYPLHRNRIAELADTYGHGGHLVWCQEEPQNMGAWTWIAPQLEEIFGRKATYAGRKPGASPAVGALALHKRELTMLLRDAFNL